MQGGRSDNSVLGRWGGRFLQAEDGESSGYESEVEVRDRISLGRRLDEAIHLARTVCAVGISLPVAWLCLHPTIAAFRERKFRVVERGTQTVLALQARLRCRVADVYFGVFSFCAEEEFYLIVLPLLIWNVDRVLGRRLTLIVCLGLMAGNTMKDVFQLPRPKSPPVWRPKHQDAIDSTNLQDFGFPSTHSMNAVTNSVFTFLYFFTSPSAVQTEGGLSALVDGWDKQKWVLVVVWYIFSLCLSRLYVGAHTPTDIRGGLVLGALWVSIYFMSSEALDEYYLATPMLTAKLVVGALVFLLLNPQPRPPTPTFEQNALLTGLVVGCMLGCRHYHDLGNLSASLSSGAAGDELVVRTGHQLANQVVLPGPLASAFVAIQRFVVQFPAAVGTVRTVAGYVVVLLLRVISKTMITAWLGLFGIAIKPKLKPGEEAPRRRKHRKGQVVHLFTRDIDIVGSAIVKVFVYAALAWAITALVPVLHILSGMRSYDLE